MRSWVHSLGWARKTGGCHSRRGWSWGSSDDLAGVGQGRGCICGIPKNWDEQGDCSGTGGQPECDVYPYEWRECAVECAYYYDVSELSSWCYVLHIVSFKKFPLILMCVRAYAYVSHDRYWLLLLFSFSFSFFFLLFFFFLCIVPEISEGREQWRALLSGDPLDFRIPNGSLVWLSLSDLSVISSLCPFLFLSVRFLSLSLISSPLCVNYLLYRTVSFSHSLPVVNFPAVNISDRSAPPPSLLIIHL